MAKYKNGERVETTGSPKRSGNVIKFETISGGQEYYTVHLDGDSQSKYVSESEIRPLTEAEDPWERLVNGSVKNHQDFGVTSTYFKVENNANNTISSLKASRTLFHAHQFKPLIKFLNSVSKRILIADEVGLGKTIEAGHILLEMYSRKEIKSSLIICPKSLLNKWQDEMFDKFGFEYKIYETKELAQDLSHDIELNRRSVFGIITYDKLKNDRLQKLIVDQHYTFDIIVCDEAHLLRNRDTQRHKAIKPIIHNSKYATMLTATPLCNGKEDLFNVLSILEPQRYHNYSMFLNDLEANKPFVRALNFLNRGVSFNEVMKELTDGSIQTQYAYGDEVTSSYESLDEAFMDDPLYNRVTNKLQSGEETIENRIDIQSDLIELNSLNHIYSRTKKREVIKNRVIRVPHDVFVTFSAEERQRYIKEEEAVKAKYANDRDATLDLINTRRQVASSLPAYYSNIEELERGNFRDEFSDSKFNKLKEIISEVVVKNDNKLIIFAFFRKTLRYLNLRLQEEFGIKCEYMDGSTEERSSLIERFKTEPDFKVLISGSIGAEGLDMQFCDAIVNYDLPWNPMKIEQRIGRIDRIGQESDKIHIYNLVIRDTVEEVIYKRLLKKIRVFEESLGDLEAILLDEETLGQKISRLETELYTQNLTEAQKEARIEQTATAVLQEKKNLEEIEKELQDSLMNDSYFNSEIERIRNNKRYITEKELTRYLQVLIRETMPSCNLLKQDEGIYKLTTPSNDPNIVFKFIEKHLNTESLQNGDATNKIYHDFKKRFYNQREFHLTFDQELAFNDKSLEFINSYHPLIIAATKYFNKAGFSVNNAYSFSVSAQELDTDIKVEKGNYILALNSISISKRFNGEDSEFTYLYPVIANPNTEELSFLSDNISEHILGIANENAEPIDIDIDFTDSGYKQFIEAVRPQIMSKLVSKKNEMEEDERVKLESLKERIRKQTISHFDYQISIREQRLRQGKGIRNIILSEIENLEIERDKKLEQLEKSSIQASMNPISVSHIQIV